MKVIDKQASVGPALTQRHLALFSHAKGATIAMAMRRIRSTPMWWKRALAAALVDGLLERRGVRVHLTDAGRMRLA